MKRAVAFLAVGCLTVGMMALLGSAQEDKSTRPSPPASASCDLGGGKTITTDYSSPRLKGRKMIGGVEPYGKVWRNGANEATTFVTTRDLVVGGKSVPAGSYTLFVIPNQDKWTLIINKKTGEWGIPYRYESDELARVDMKLSTLPSPVENFTIAYDKAGTGCTLREEWDTTRATVGITPK
ncbi:MAG TPA: DUF2911 domain-containing protein [Candidatus Acidoferrum sp.]|jgi:hypothetical protein|nr:DUF2911 domain-containing protein [Candidatus Acidoferrum sp.]